MTTHPDRRPGCLYVVLAMGTNPPRVETHEGRSGWPGHYSACSKSAHAGTPLAGKAVQP